MALAEVESFVKDGRVSSLDLRLSPCSRVWPMSFAWSSHCIQAYMCDTCEAAGFEPSTFICEEGVLPPTTGGAIAVATDDITHFERGSCQEIEGLG